MKQFLYKMMALSLLTIGGVATAWAQDTYVGTTTGDCWVSSDHQNVNNKQIEMKNNSDAAKFYGVMGFEFTAPNSGYEVASAKLRLTTRYKKGDSELAVYALKADVTDGSTYDQLSAAISAAMATAPIVTFRVNGSGAWAPTDGGIGDDYLTVDKWQNTIDLTSYVKTLGGNKFAIVMQKTYVQDNSTQVYSKEATDETNSTKGFTFAAADLIPQLTVTYQEATGVRAVTAGASNDLWVRTDNESSTVAGNEIEIKNYNGTKFYGLLDFDFVKPANDEVVKSATLRLVTRYKKGDSQVRMYGYNGTVDESSTNYGNAQTDISAALANTPVADFKLNSSAQWAPTDGGVGDDYLTVDKWTNTLDVTEYIRTLAASGHVAFLLEKVYNQDNSSQIFSKEASDQVNATKGFTFKKEDLVPVLTITYQKMIDYTLEVTEAGAATLILPFEAKIPAGVKAYTLNYTGGDAATATELTEGKIAANTPVLLNAEAGSYQFVNSAKVDAVTTGSGTHTVGALTGVYATTTVPATGYILTVDGTSVGFKKSNGSATVEAYHAYLTAEGAGTRGFLDIDFGGTTGITQMDDVRSEKADVYYDLQGHRVLYPKKGLYIVNGKKVIIK